MTTEEQDHLAILRGKALLEQGEARLRPSRDWLVMGAIPLCLTLVGLLVAWSLTKTPAYAAGPIPTTRPAPAQKEVRARAFILEDENGRAVATLITERGGTVLRLCDAKGDARAMLSVTNDGPSLGLFDENDHLRAALVAHKAGSGMMLHDENGKTRIGAAVLKDDARICFWKADGQTIWQAP